ncbi:hypothetical protein E4T91_04790 [Ligilactobacillus murinus]|uniref:hypothetical protein n=1 Tax=Ligilactobacillus murinus TaxID=1622 RepID=UPI001072992E|nr:hypothetical protein [Ligilactobacillus murinus]MBF0758066.1 hypothetical protein [Ligilactobacillus murinus]MBF0832656.1 hypothetical protein [Ligilactobacillus murinus]MBF0845066.1 hypothetical protein [Streptococcus danieliae]TFU64697.1 hypothetical protein E4T91_04790 [Ligilactobacillus murinus]
MLEQIKKDACWLFEEERSDKDGVKYAMAMYLLAIVLLTAIFGVAGLVTPFVVEWLRAKKKTTSAPASGQPTSQSQPKSKL